MDLSTQDKSIFSSLNTYLNKIQNNSDIEPLIIANSKYIYLSVTKKVYEKKDKQWIEIDFDGDYLQLFALNHDENLQEGMKSLSIDSNVFNESKRIRNASTDVKKLTFIREFIRLSQNEPKDLLLDIKWIKSSEERLNVIEALLEKMKKTKNNHYSEVYNSWFEFCLWIKLYEQQKDESLNNDLKKIFKGKKGSEAVKPIAWANRFKEFFSLLPKGVFEYSSLPLSYFKHFPVSDWNDLKEKFEKYIAGDLDVINEFKEFLNETGDSRNNTVEIHHVTSDDEDDYDN